MSIGWDVSELLAERELLRKKLESSENRGRYWSDRAKLLERRNEGLDSLLRVERERYANLQGELEDAVTRLRFAQNSAILSSRTMAVALTRLQAALAIVEAARYVRERRYSVKCELGREDRRVFDKLALVVDAYQAAVDGRPSS